MTSPVFSMQAATGVSYGEITGTPSGAIYVPNATGLINNVALMDVSTLQVLGYVIVPTNPAASTTGNGTVGGSGNLTGGTGAASGGGNGNGGAGGAVTLAGGKGGLANGSGTQGKGGQVNVTGGAGSGTGNSTGGDVVIQGGAKSGSGTVGNVLVPTLPTADPYVVGALWANSGIVTVSAG